MIDDFTQYAFAILGGDRRQTILADKLIERGHKVKVFGLGEFDMNINNAQICSSVEKAVSGCDIILLPLPVSKDKINLALCSEQSCNKIALADIVDLAVKHGCKSIIGGVIPQEIIDKAHVKGLEAIDFYSDKEFQKRNALPSAEGAIMIAMEHTEKTLDGMRVLICGYGKTGSCLATLLKKLGATVSVAARGDEALCEASMSGYYTVRLDEHYENIADLAERCDVVFNTVPSMIFNERVLDKMEYLPLYIEIASAPGGIDILAASERQMRVIIAPSIPGKYAPVSAGQYIFEAVSDILNKRGIRI